MLLTAGLYFGSAHRPKCDFCEQESFGVNSLYACEMNLSELKGVPVNLLLLSTSTALALLGFLVQGPVQGFVFLT